MPTLYLVDHEEFPEERNYIFLSQDDAENFKRTNVSSGGASIREIVFEMDIKSIRDAMMHVMEICLQHSQND